MANEISVRNTFLAGATATDSEFEREMAEQMAGAQMSFPRIKMPAGGMLVFNAENDSPKDLTGVIVDQHPFNAFWKDRDSVDGSVPDCYSPDGVHGIKNTPNAEGSTGNCANCPYNKFGSGYGGRGKACSNKRAVYILRDGETVPTELDLPPSSIKSFDSYLSYLRQNRKLLSSVVTEISLERKTMNNNQVAVAKFAKVAELAPEASREAMEYSKSIRDMVRNQSGGFTETDEDDPFNV